MASFSWEDYNDAYRVNPWTDTENGPLSHEQLALGWNSPQITLIVGSGEDQVHFRVPEPWLSVIDFFKKALQGNFKEAHEGIINMPEEDPNVIKLFLLWLVRSGERVEDLLPDTAIGRGVDLMILADKWIVPELFDQCCRDLYDQCLREISHRDPLEIFSLSYHSLEGHKARYIPIHVAVQLLWGKPEIIQVEFEAILLKCTKSAVFYGEFGKYKAFYNMAMNYSESERSDSSWEDPMMRSPCIIESVVSGKLDEIDIPMEQFGPAGWEGAGLGDQATWIRELLDL